MLTLHQDIFQSHLLLISICPIFPKDKKCFRKDFKESLKESKIYEIILKNLFLHSLIYNIQFRR